MTILALLALGVSLSISPVKGPAPLTVNASAEVTGPFVGVVCLQVASETDVHGNSLLGCEDLNAPEGVTPIKFPELTGGVAGNNYEFTATLETVEGLTVETSEPVKVTVE